MKTKKPTEGYETRKLREALIKSYQVMNAAQVMIRRHHGTVVEDYPPDVKALRAAISGQLSALEHLGAHL